MRGAISIRSKVSTLPPPSKSSPLYRQDFPPQHRYFHPLNIQVCVTQRPSFHPSEALRQGLRPQSRSHCPSTEAFAPFVRRLQPTSELNVLPLFWAWGCDCLWWVCQTLFRYDPSMEPPPPTGLAELASAPRWVPAFSRTWPLSVKRDPSIPYACVGHVLVVHRRWARLD